MTTRAITKRRWHGFACAQPQRWPRRSSGPLAPARVAPRPRLMPRWCGRALDASAPTGIAVRQAPMHGDQAALGEFDRAIGVSAQQRLAGAAERLLLIAPKRHVQ